MELLPTEIRNHIFGFLNPVELFATSRTCSLFNNIANNCSMDSMALYAAECGSINILEYAIAHKYTPLFPVVAMASDKGHYDFIKYLKGKSLYIDNHGATYAARTKQIKILELFHISKNDKLFFETVFDTDDHEYIRYILDKYGCSIKISDSKCSDLQVFELLYSRNILSEKYFLHNDYKFKMVTKTKQLDSLIWLFEKINDKNNLRERLYNIVMYAVKTCDVDYLKNILDNTILFPDTKLTHKEKIRSIHQNTPYRRQFISHVIQSKSLEKQPMLEYLLKIEDTSGKINTCPNSIFDHMWLEHNNITVNSKKLYNSYYDCFFTGNTSAIEYFKANKTPNILDACMDASLESGDVGGMHWAIDNGFNICDSTIKSCYEHAIKSGRTEIIEFVRDNSKNCSVNISTQRELLSIACSVDVDVLKYILGVFNYEFCDRDCIYIMNSVRSGKIDIVRWLCANGCPKSNIIMFSQHVMNYILRYDDADMLHILCELDLKYARAYRQAVKMAFAAKCYICISKNYGNKPIGYHKVTYSCFKNRDGIFEEKFISNISELKKYVCNHVYCRSKYDNVRCLQKGMIAIKEYKKSIVSQTLSA